MTLKIEMDPRMPLLEVSRLCTIAKLVESSQSLYPIMSSRLLNRLSGFQNLHRLTFSTLTVEDNRPSNSLKARRISACWVLCFSCPERDFKARNSCDAALPARSRSREQNQEQNLAA